MHLYWKMGVIELACGHKQAGVEHQVSKAMQSDHNQTEVQIEKITQILSLER